MTTIIENIPKADCPAANAVHAGVSASWESLMPLLLADDQKAPNEHAEMLYCGLFGSIFYQPQIFGRRVLDYLAFSELFPQSEDLA